MTSQLCRQGYLPLTRFLEPDLDIFADVLCTKEYRRAVLALGYSPEDLKTHVLRPMNREEHNAESDAIFIGETLYFYRQLISARLSLFSPSTPISSSSSSSASSSSASISASLSTSMMDLSFLVSAVNPRHSTGFLEKKEMVFSHYMEYQGEPKWKSCMNLLSGRCTVPESGLYSITAGPSKGQHMVIKNTINSELCFYIRIETKRTINLDIMKTSMQLNRDHVVFVHSPFMSTMTQLDAGDEIWMSVVPGSDGVEICGATNTLTVARIA